MREARTQFPYCTSKRVWETLISLLPARPATQVNRLSVMSARIRHALVVLDPASKDQPALERAAWFAERTGASLELFICDYDQELAEFGPFDAEALDGARRRLIATHVRTLKEHARRLSARGLSVRVDAHWGHPLATGIVRKAIACNADLVFKATPYDERLRRSLFSNVDWTLIRSCPARLWLVKPRAAAEGAPVVAAVDPARANRAASFDDRIIATAEGLRCAFGGELEVFHAYDLAPSLATSRSLITPLAAPFHEVTTVLRRRHEEAVAELIRRHALPRYRLQIHEGPAGRMMAAVCEQTNAGLIVMGALSRTGWPERYLGSTAEHVLDRLPCDVLIVPAESTNDAVIA